jgi:hypothetical protein
MTRMAADEIPRVCLCLICEHLRHLRLRILVRGFIRVRNGTADFADDADGAGDSCLRVICAHVAKK